MDAQWHTVRFNVGCVSLICVLSEVLLRGSGRESLWLQNSCSVPCAHTYTAQRMTQQVSYTDLRLIYDLKKHWLTGSFGTLEVSPDAVRYFHLTSTAPELHLSVITASELLSLTFFFKQKHQNSDSDFISLFLLLCVFERSEENYIDIAYSGVQLCFI